MKKTSKIFSAVLIFFVIIGLTVPFALIFAQENLQAPLKDVTNKVDELIELKDNTTLSDQEKEQKEIEIRKEALEKILSLSLIEIKNLEDKINALNLSSKDQLAIKEKFLEILESNKQFSTELNSKIEKDSLTLEEIKNFAQEYKDWRDSNYNKYVKKINVFILTFQEKQFLKTADTRLQKIMSDLKKLEDLRILKKEDTSSFIEASMKNLTTAENLNKDAETLITSTIKKELLETASSTTIIEKESATTTQKLEIIEEAPALSLMAAPEQIASTSPKIIPEEDTAQTMIEKALTEIKNAYSNFIGISNKVSQKLKLK